MHYVLLNLNFMKTSIDPSNQMIKHHLPVLQKVVVTEYARNLRLPEQEFPY